VSYHLDLYLFRTPVRIELALQVLLSACAVTLIGGGSEELLLAFCTGRQRRNLIHVFQDNEAALHHVHWITFRLMSTSCENYTLEVATCRSRQLRIRHANSPVKQERRPSSS
jgi:hypothetical protein